MEEIAVGAKRQQREIARKWELRYSQAVSVRDGRESAQGVISHAPRTCAAVRNLGYDVCSHLNDERDLEEQNRTCSGACGSV